VIDSDSYTQLQKGTVDQWDEATRTVIPSVEKATAARRDLERRAGAFPEAKAAASGLLKGAMQTGAAIVGGGAAATATEQFAQLAVEIAPQLVEVRRALIGACRTLVAGWRRLSTRLLLVAIIPSAPSGIVEVEDAKPARPTGTGLRRTGGGVVRRGSGEFQIHMSKFDEVVTVYCAQSAGHGFVVRKYTKIGVGRRAALQHPLGQMLAQIGHPRALLGTDKDTIHAAVVQFHGI